MALSNGTNEANCDVTTNNIDSEHGHNEYNSLISANQTIVVEYIDGAPYLLKWRSSKAFILITVCVALFTDSVIYGVLVPVLPFVLKDRCHIAEGTEQLWTSAMFAVFGAAVLIGSPICGWYGDRSSSRRLPLLLSLPVLTAATALLGASTDVGVFLLSRALQGFSTSVVYTIGLALIRDSVQISEVAQWMGAAISSNSLGLVISPTLGGIIYSQAGLWGVLGVMIGLVCLNIVLVVLMVERRVAARYIRVNASTATVPEYTSYGTISESQIGTVHPNQEMSTDDANENSNERLSEDIDPYAPYPSPAPVSRLPIILQLMKSPRILTGTYGVFTQFGLLASFDAFLPLFVERKFGWSSLGSGLIFLAIALPALLGPVAGKISDRFGPRPVALAGCVLTTPPLILLKVVGNEDRGHVVLLCVLLTLIGIFLTLIISPLAADISFAIDDMETKHPGIFGKKGAYAQGYALFNCAMAAACVAGPLVAGGIQDRYGGGTVAWVLGLWCASAAIPVLFFTGGRRTTVEYSTANRNN